MNYNRNLYNKFLWRYIIKMISCIMWFTFFP